MYPLKIPFRYYVFLKDTLNMYPLNDIDVFFPVQNINDTNAILTIPMANMPEVRPFQG